MGQVATINGKIILGQRTYTDTILRCIRARAGTNNYCCPYKSDDQIGDGVSWHVTILSLHVPVVYSMRFTFQCFLRPTFHIVLLSSHAAVVPTRLLIAAPALGTFTGWRWSVLYPGDVGAEDRHLEAV